MQNDFLPEFSIYYFEQEYLKLKDENSQPRETTVNLWLSWK